MFEVARTAIASYVVYFAVRRLYGFHLFKKYVTGGVFVK